MVSFCWQKTLQKKASAPDKDGKKEPITETKPAETDSETTVDTNESKNESAFQKLMNGPERLTIAEPADEKTKEAFEKLTKDNPKLKAALEGAEYVPITAEDVGVEALDEYTFQVTLLATSSIFCWTINTSIFRSFAQTNN